jgi:Domain of unknown function (DUF4136)
MAAPGTTQETVMFLKIKSEPTHLALLVTLVLFSCGLTLAQDVHYNFKPGTDFSKYHTYKWIELPENAHPNQIVQQAIKDSIDRQLAGKGLSKTDSDKADLYVGYQTAMDQEKQLHGFRDGFGPWGFGGMATVTTSTIQNGSLVLNMYDVTGKQLVWTGQVTKTLDPSGNQQKEINKLDSAMKKLLRGFPPPLKK